MTFSQSQSKVNAILMETNISLEYLTENNLWDGDWLKKSSSDVIDSPEVKEKYIISLFDISDDFSGFFWSQAIHGCVRRCRSRSRPPWIP